MRGKRPVSILVGSPMSVPDSQDSPGVPGVSGILRSIETHVADAGLEQKYREQVNTDNDISQYQESFMFIRDWLSQDDVNKIIQNSVVQARIAGSRQGDPAELDKDIAGWHLPSGTKALGEIVSKSDKFTGPILTTNFDPLLSVSVSKSGCIPVQTVLHTDGKLGQQRVLDDKCRSIVHLHGYWHDSDTLHTPDQLVADRPNLKASLRRLLSERMLLVVGYGGWDDVFLSALNDLIYDERAELDVLWAFFESDSSTINEKYKSLLSKVEAAKARGRFRMYGGVDCHTFFPALLNSLCPHDEKAKTEKIAYSTAQAESQLGSDAGQDAILSIAGKSASSKIDTFKKWVPKASDAHLQIRAVEKELFSDALSKSRAVYVASDWGMGKEGFIYSLTQSKKPPISIESCYRINIEDVTDRDTFFRVAEEQLGTKIQIFAIEAAKEADVTLFIDGVSSSTATGGKDEWIIVLNEIVNALIDFSPSLKVVLTGRQSIKDISIPTVKLEPLDEADVCAYISEHSDGGEVLSRGRGLEVLYRLSSGLPVSLDTLLSELTILSLDELLESESNNIGDISSEPVPVALERAIINLATANDDHQKRSFSLLKILSVLEFGESLKNVKRFNKSKPLYPSNIRELKDLGLVTTTSVYRDTPALSDSKERTQEELAKIHSVQPLVRERVLKLISSDEIKNIVERATDIAFGGKWREGQIKLNLSVTQHLEDTARSGSGNPHLLASQMLRYSVENDNETEIKRAFNIGIAYCKKLELHSRYRDVVNTSKELISIVNDVSDIISFPELLVINGSALRMQGHEEEAIDVILEALQYDSLSKKLRGSANLELALAYESIGEDNHAVESAKVVLSLEKKNSSRYMQASSIIVEAKGDENKEAELSTLEREARESGSNITANNLAITIADSKSNTFQKIDIYNRVLADSSDQYNQMRAVMRKGSALSSISSIGDLTYHENKLLRQAYEYGFSQRLSSFYGKSLEVLWEKFEIEGDTQKLIELFRYSSLMWRLEGKIDREKKYAEKLSDYMKLEPNKKSNKNLESLTRKYVVVRLRFLSPSKRKRRRK